MSTNWQKRYPIWFGTTLISGTKRFRRRKVLSESNVREYKAIVEKLGPKLNAFINCAKA